MAKISRRPNRTKAFWLEHIKHWQASGLSKADYCRQHQLNVGNFYNWCSTESATGKPFKQPSATVEPPTLIPVTLTDVGMTADSSSTVSLQHQRGEFRFPADLPSGHIIRWLQAIEQTHV